MIATAGDLGGIANTRAELYHSSSVQLCNLVSSLAFAMALKKNARKVIRVKPKAADNAAAEQLQRQQ